MLISVVADVHGNFDALARVADKAEQLVILGDLLDYVDYHDPTRGIMAEMFGEQQVRNFTALRSVGAFTELRDLNSRLWNSLSDPVGVLSAMVQERYRRVLDVVPDNTLVTLGNVDVADEWNRVAGETMPFRDGESLDIDGVRFAFVAGGVYRHRSAGAVLPLGADITGSNSAPHPVAEPRPWRPMMRPQDEFQRIVAGLGDADVLCSHIPPNLPLLRYDVVPGRTEMAGPGLTDYMHRFEPVLALFGHVHQPLSQRGRFSLTECVNVGHFQQTEQAFIVDTDRIHAARTRATAISVSAGR